MTEKQIFDFLVKSGCTLFGAAGLMGNLIAESNLNPINLENYYNNKYSVSDEQYTKEVDEGRRTFIDNAGYGIAQWTYHTRKQNLLNWARKENKSIGDIEMQLRFLVWELQNYASVWSVLTKATYVKQASDVVLTKFENPADQSENMKQRRAELGQGVYSRCTGVKGEEVNMGFTNSPLVVFTKISPNKNSPRTNKIDTITIHCMAGNATIESCGNLFFNPTVQASSNYGVGTDGRIGLYVEEKDRSWCSSNWQNDDRAITIEVANDGGEPDWHVSDRALAATIKLCADICKRNGIKALKWSDNKAERVNHLNGVNMTVHRDYANKACPGNYLMSKMQYIANEVNKLIGGQVSQQTTKILYRVQVGAFKEKNRALALAKTIEGLGEDCFVKTEGQYYKVQVGAFSVKSNAENTKKRLKTKGYDSIITVG